MLRSVNDYFDYEIKTSIENIRKSQRNWQTTTDVHIREHIYCTFC